MKISNVDRTRLRELAAMVRQPYDANDLSDAADRGADLADAVLTILGKDVTSWIDIREETLLAAAKKRWPSTTCVAPPHWIDTQEPLLRVGITLSGCTHFGACYNYQTGEFES